ncbi:hypothetical protein AAC387_Pa02g4704 [Persea americana]
MSTGTSLPSDTIDFTIDFGLMGWSSSSGHIFFPMAQRDVGCSMSLIHPRGNVGSGLHFNSRNPYLHCSHNLQSVLGIPCMDHITTSVCHASAPSSIMKQCRVQNRFRLLLLSSTYPWDSLFSYLLSKTFTESSKTM